MPPVWLRHEYFELWPGGTGMFGPIPPGTSVTISCSEPVDHDHDSSLVAVEAVALK